MKIICSLTLKRLDNGKITFGDFSEDELKLKVSKFLEKLKSGFYENPTKDELYEYDFKLVDVLEED